MHVARTCLLLSHCAEVLNLDVESPQQSDAVRKRKKLSTTKKKGADADVIDFEPPSPPRERKRCVHWLICAVWRYYFQ